MRLGPVLLSIVLLLANGFFVAMEFALIAARRTRIEQLAEEGSVLARTALSSMRELSFMLSGAQLGITMASLGLGHVAEPAVAHVLETALGSVITLPPNVLHTISLVMALSIVVFLHMVVGEMVPKNIAIAEPERSALWMAVPIRAYAGLFRPAIHLLNVTANACLRLLRVEPRDELLIASTADEIASMLAESRREGLIEEFEHFLLSGALRFRDREVRSVMAPRDRVAALPRSATVAQAEAFVNETGHTRIPVYGSGLDDVLGFIHAKDLLRIDPSDRERPVPPDLLRAMPLVTTTTKLGSVLVHMRRTRTHFALVVDVRRKVVGIVTLEDVLEELVGDIADEYDVGTPSGRSPRSPRRS